MSILLFKVNLFNESESQSQRKGYRGFVFDSMGTSLHLESF